MTDRPPGEPLEPAAARGDAADPAIATDRDDAGQKVQRRAFLRQLTGDAVVATGRLAGLSTALRRSVVAAGVAAVGEPDPAGDAEPSSSPVPAQAAVEPPVVERAAVAEPPALAVPAAPPQPAPDPASRLTPHQHELLERGTTAILGVNDRSGAPHLTASTFHWDGSTLRLPSELFAARVARIEADPRVSVLVDLGEESWVAVTGTADVVSGEAVAAEMLPVLRKQMTDDEAERAWAEMRSSGDRVVIRIRPTRFVWRTA